MATPARKADILRSINLANPAHLTLVRKYKFLLARSAFNSDAAMAEAFGVDRSNMTRWKQGAGLSAENSDKIEESRLSSHSCSRFFLPRQFPNGCVESTRISIIGGRWM